MRRFTLLLSAMAFIFGFASCNDTNVPFEWPDDEEGFLNQELVIRNEDGSEVKTKNKLAIGNKKSYPIGSVFFGGSVADPLKGAGHRCHFYGETFKEGPQWDKVQSMIHITGFWYQGVEYTDRGQSIDYIGIYGLDPSLLYGEELNIPLNQGKYEGGCDLVQDVKINTYKMSTYKDDHYTFNDDAHIDIRIVMKDGTIISILFAGTTLDDGYI